MLCRLIDFALLILKLLIFQIFGITGISKFEFSKFSVTQSVRQNKTKIKKYSKHTKLMGQSLSISTKSLSLQTFLE